MLQNKLPNELCTCWNSASGSLSQEFKISVRGGLVLLRPLVDPHILFTEANQSSIEAWVLIDIALKDLPHVELLHDSR